MILVSNRVGQSKPESESHPNFTILNKLDVVISWIFLLEVFLNAIILPMYLSLSHGNAYNENEWLIIEAFSYLRPVMHMISL